MALAPGVAGAQETVVVGAAGGGEVAVLDACWEAGSRYRVAGRVEGLALSRDGRRAFVAHSSREGATGAVTMLDLADGRTERRVGLGSTGRVTDVWLARDGGRLWAATVRDGRVLTLGTITGKLLQVWVIGRDSPQRGAVGPGDRLLYVTNRAAGTLTVVDRVTLGSHILDVGKGVGPVAASPRGREAWVALPDRDLIVVADAVAGAVTDSFPSGGEEPGQLRFAPDGTEVWVLHGGSRELSVLDASSRRVLGRIGLPGRPGRLRFSPDRARVLVTLPGRSAVALVDAVRRELVSVHPVAVLPDALDWEGCAGRACGAPGAPGEGAWGSSGEGYREGDLVSDLDCGAPR